MVTQGLQTGLVDSISRRGGASPDMQNVDPKKWKIAQDFEAMFIHQMLKSMRNTVSEESISGEESSGRRIFTEMLDEEMSKRASRQGGLGLAELIYRHMGENTTAPEKMVPLNMLRNTAYSTGAASVRRASAEQIDGWVEEASATLQVDPNLVRSVIQQESAGNSTAYSPKGAKGLMQLMDGTARDMGVTQVWDGRQNVIGGTRYLKQLLERFDGDESLALAAYNAGPEAVRKHGGIPPYTETQDYVKKVLGYRRQLQQDKEVAYDG